jgi:hypothetical protein
MLATALLPLRTGCGNKIGHKNVCYKPMRRTCAYFKKINKKEKSSRKIEILEANVKLPNMNFSASSQCLTFNMVAGIKLMSWFSGCEKKKTFIASEINVLGL